MAKTNPTTVKAAAAPVGQPVVGANKPVEKATKPERKKLETVWHPDLKPNDDGPTVKLTAWPADFKTTKHKPLSANHFEDPATFYIGKAERLEKQAADLRRQAETAKQLGGKDKGAAKKLVGLMKRMDDLKAELSGKGVDVEAMLKILMEKQAPAPQPESQPA